jgi:hypothetical protein
MSWYELSQEDDPDHRLHVLLNDRLDVLARIETFDCHVFYPWVMDREDPRVLRRVGPMIYPIAYVRKYCERILDGAAPQDHSTPVEPRPLAAGLPD